jgi:hypothetical protein
MKVGMAEIPASEAISCGIKRFYPKTMISLRSLEKSIAPIAKIMERSLMVPWELSCCGDQARKTYTTFIDIHFVVFYLARRIF